MSFEVIISIMLFALGLYILLGVVFGFLFIAKGLAKIDPATKGSSIAFKILVFPGTVALWPFLLKKWIKVK